MDIYLIRHTKVEIEKGVCYGQSDVPCAHAPKLPKLPQNALIISSPLQRCLHLAYQLSDSVIIDKRIMELNFGDWEMQKWDDINQKLLQQWMNDYVNIAPPNGESFQTLFQRCQAFWHDITQKNAQILVIVTHLGVIRALLAHVLEMPLKKSMSIQVDYGAINKLRYHFNYKTSWTTIEYLNHSEKI